MTTRRAWLVRPPKTGSFDQQALEKGVVTAEFDVRGDLSDHIDPEMIHAEIQQASPDNPRTTLDALARQLNTLLNEMQPGDLVLHPHDQRRSLAIGLLRAGTCQDRDGRPARSVEWLRRDIPKSALRKDLQHSFSSGAQVCEISRNDALSRISSIVETGRDPGPGGEATAAAETLSPEKVIPALEDMTRLHVGTAFAGHDLSDLVAALLEVEGYTVRVSPPGADGGCDLVAARGPLGIEGPTIAGQVKSGDIVADHPTLQSLRGTMQSHGADKGLLVAWSGVTRPVAQDLDMLRLQIAFWDGAEICRRLLRDYDRMPLWVRDRLLLRRVPVLEAR